MKELDSFTVERLEEFIRHPLESGLTRSEQMELARIALAAKRAEPVAWVVGDATLYNSHTVEAYAKRSGLPVSPLYTTPQLNSPEMPEGWKLVPNVVTKEMTDAARIIDGRLSAEKYHRIYRLMLATAPNTSGFDPSFPGTEATVITHYHTPDGYKLVPTEITKAMRDAWDSAPNGHEDDDVNMCNAYRAMIAAAPEKPLWPMKY
ncbi:hypothetical protein V1956_15520 [Yersinia sp. 2540 StPb PI]|uniref:hypothetical protein n=1 Tax=Yersinia sp. 2540 StPb PI TaxID=3117406 RepID=UPI003FA4A704